MNRECLKVYSGPWTLSGGHWCAPCILVREGVMAGSDGPMFWPASTIEAMAGLWHDVPLSLGHPMGSNGKPVSIKAAQEHVIGTVTNPVYDHVSRSLRATIKVPEGVWRVHQLQAMKEVSVGVFVETVITDGEFQGTRYHGLTRKATPDHLAVLPPGQTGACSFSEHGCGIRAYASEIDELRALAGQTLTNWVNDILGKRSSIMRNYMEQAYYPPSVNEEASELEILAGWENCGPNMLAPVEIQALRMKHEKRQEKQSTGHVAAAMYPPGVE